jgi:preprotein translocase subunit YajC
VKKYAEMSDQKIREQYKREAEAEASEGPATGTRANQKQVTGRSLLRNDPDNILINKSMWVRGSYVGQKGTAVRVKVLKRTSLTPRKYKVVRTGNATASRHHTLTVEQLMETYRKSETAVEIADRGTSVADAIKTEVRIPKDKADRQKKKKAKSKQMKQEYKSVKKGSKFRHTGGDNLVYTVVSVDYKGKGTVVARNSKKVEYDFKLSYVKKVLL